MSYRIVVDSCGELTEEMKESGRFVTAPLSIQVEDHFIVDDETFDQASFLKLIADSPNGPKSSCPSPEKYMEYYNCEEERVYAVTLSAELSGSYNSAVLGKNLYEEEIGEKQIYVFNSRSASVGESLIGLKIQEYEEQGLEFEEVVEKVEEYIETQNTWFVLENLETLRKNGRLSKVKAFVATALKIKPIMTATVDGEITQLDQARGINKALIKMVNYIAETAEDPENRILAISHCNCKERAMMVRDALLEKMKVKDVFVVDTAGISTMYANDGGIIVAI